MANPNEKVPENKPGRYYVDRQCIDCDICRDIAKDNFTRQSARGYSYVYQQPDNSDQDALCREALEACPVDAIGNDGS